MSSEKEVSVSPPSRPDHPPAAAAAAPQLSLGFLGPRMVLTSFTALMLLTYVDRGLFAASLKAIETQLKIGETKAGLLGSVFMVGYVLSSPVFARAANTQRPLYLMAAGLSVWCLAVVLTGLSFSFAAMLAARSLTGIGEASFLCLAPPFVNAAAPPKSRSLWLSVFFLSIPAGYALGYMFGGQFLEWLALGETWTFRALFLGEAVLMLPLIALVIAAKGPASMKEVENLLPPSSGHGAAPVSDASVAENSQIGGSSAGSPLVGKREEKGFKDAIRDFAILGSNSLYDLIVLGYAAQTFVVGGVAYFGLKYTTDFLHYKESQGAFYFGGVALFAGIFGTATGGIVLDMLRSRYGGDPASSLVHALTIMVVCSIIGIPMCIGPFIFPVEKFAFFVFLLIGEFFLFCCLSPTNAAILWAVPVSLQPLAVAGGIIVVHVLGDAISPVIIGKILDASNHDWNLAMMVMCLVLIPSTIVWSFGLLIAYRRRKEAILDGTLVPTVATPSKGDLEN